MDHYTSEELAKAMVEANRLGIISTHFVAVNAKHFNHLLETGDIGFVPGSFVKKSTGKPVWICFPNKNGN